MSKSEFIKRPHQTNEYTYEQAIEIVRCTMDPIYFMKTYMKVQHPTRGSIPFDMYPYQEDAIKSFLGHKAPPVPVPKGTIDPVAKFGQDCVVMLGRQMGKCVFGNTAINIARKPKGLKKLILRLAFPKLYEKIFRPRAS